MSADALGSDEHGRLLLSYQPDHRQFCRAAPGGRLLPEDLSESIRERTAALVLSWLRSDAAGLSTHASKLLFMSPSVAWQVYEAALGLQLETEPELCRSIIMGLIQHQHSASYNPSGRQAVQRPNNLWLPTALADSHGLATYKELEQIGSHRALLVAQHMAARGLNPGARAMDALLAYCSAASKPWHAGTVFKIMQNLNIPVRERHFLLYLVSGRSLTKPWLMQRHVSKVRTQMWDNGQALTPKVARSMLHLFWHQVLWACAVLCLPCLKMAC